MSNDITRGFDSIFTLDSSKLSRLLSVIEDRFKDASKSIISNHEILTRNGKSFSTSDIETILKHDNSINNPIIELMISYQDQKESPPNIVRIIFRKDESKIRVIIRTDEPKFGSDLYAEVEEQIERTQNNDWAYSIKKLELHSLLMFMFMPLILILIFSLFYPTPEQNLKITDYLSNEDILSLSEYENPITENKKIGFLYEYHTRKIANMNKPKSDFFELSIIENVFNLKVGLLMLPIVVVLFGIYYIVNKTYLGSMFLWGDYLEHNNALIEKRKFVWNAVVVAIFISIIGGLFVFGLSQYFE